MSRFFSDRFASLTAYVPGEQPQDQQYVKLNTTNHPIPLPRARAVPFRMRSWHGLTFIPIQQGCACAIPLPPITA